MNSGTWQATVHGVAENQTQPNDQHYRKEAVGMGVVWGIFLTDPIILT